MDRREFVKLLAAAGVVTHGYIPPVVGAVVPPPIPVRVGTGPIPVYVLVSMRSANLTYWVTPGHVPVDYKGQRYEPIGCCMEINPEYPGMKFTVPSDSMLRALWDDTTDEVRADFQIVTGAAELASVYGVTDVPIEITFVR